MDTDTIVGTAIGLTALGVMAHVATKMIDKAPKARPVKPLKTPKCHKQKCLLKSKHSKLKW